MRLLVVDDEATVRELLSDALRFAGFTVASAATGAEAVALAAREPPDLILLDVTLPGMDGFEVVRRMRATGGKVPVLFLSARDAPDDKVTGLSAGGDDYVTKPFHLRELIARIEAILRRAGSGPPSIGGLTLDPDTSEVTRDGRVVRLSPTEFRLLRHLIAHAGRVVSKPDLLAAVWRYDFAGDTGIVDTYVSYLRRKIDTSPPRLIHTQRGAGYVLKVPPP
ncbi:response regulator transcription factor [Actinoplanes derwentensis]|uniref:Two-component system, OmpR family, response regulator n=1 Tax=Actinoplanes derwentensis TaxID=113562 RepID=A0A1H1QFE1_9ACTN|nr:response regulator transcription factor [Actinoplanes derwentensis]GID82155.1 DNA-binding response regulator [Actinoplanes derwentensis]SDS22007.1 two-component system, OmpR family, response regulator [Actinoplanes derwentensis]